MKGVNSSILDQAYDPGKDSDQAGINATFAKDVVGYGLHYYTDDYAAINGTRQQAQASVNNTSHAATNSHDLYNGNIRYMQTSITNPGELTGLPMLNAYKYDQLNRLIESRSYETGLASNLWNPLSYGNSYYNAFTYNADGNILTQQRHKRDGTQIEDLTYRYQHNNDGELIRNRLYHVNDAITSNVDSSDIDDMGLFEDDYLLINTDNNYAYDEEGRLIKDVQEEIEHIVWRVDGKVKSIVRPVGSNRKNITFDYDAMGKRIAKHLINPQTDMLEKSTYYVLDAQGQQLSMYEHIVDSSEVKYHLAERNVYGSSRLGTAKGTVNMYAPELLPSYGVFGNRNYELSNHLGSVLAVVTDHVVALDNDLDEEVDGYQVSLAMVSDYSPFGVQLDGRTVDNIEYRYGFQNQEKDDEVKGNGNSYTTEFRQYDPRLARWSSIDPLMTKYPFYSPYSTLNNNPLRFTDRLGLEGQDWIRRSGSQKWEWDASIKSEGQATQKYGDGTEYKAPGGTYRAADGRKIRLGSGPNDWISVEKNENGNYTNQQGMPIDNDYAEQKLEAQRFHEKIMANHAALEGFFTDIFFTVATLPFGGGGGLLARGAGGFLLKSAVREAIVGGTVNAAGNFTGQLIATGDVSKVDGLSIVGAGVSGVFKNPWVGTAVTGSIDAAFDIKFNGSIEIAGRDKPLNSVVSDLFFSGVSGSTGNLLQLGEAPLILQNSRNFIVGGGTQYFNGKVNDKLQGQ